MDYSQTLIQLFNWYNNYAAAFTGSPGDLREAVLLKQEHTRRVCDDMDQLCNSINLQDPLLFAARVVALFHDIGRFQQYKDYSTFQDRKSINHSQLGVKIIEENHLLCGFPDEISQIIKTAVFYHSSKAVPENLPKEQDLLCRLIRDADKLDIYSIVASHYTNPHQARKEIIETGLPDLPIVSSEICASVTQGAIVDFSKIRCLNDFKLIQLGWVYDLNFTRSFQLVKQRGHFDLIRVQLPSVPEVKYAVELACKYLESKAAEIKENYPGAPEGVPRW